MNYYEALNFINEKQSLGIKPGLTRIKELLKQMGNPQNDYKIIHIAGTNGKGTVAATIAQALANSGKKTGLFTSPWVIDYREQIQINGNFISENDFAKYVTDYCDNDCTEFELLTAVMYKYFSDSAVDYAVIECGMGGLDDATNVEDENISVITSISLDHTDFLGKTIDEIAEQKSGILRNNSTCFLYNSDLKEHFINKCSKLYTEGLNSNLTLVNAVLNELNINSVNELSSLPARQEKIGNILLDGGHNYSAALSLKDKLNNEIAVIGMLKDKDIEGYLSLIAPKCRKIIAVNINHFRAMPVKELAKIAEKYCKDVIIIENPSKAIKVEGVSLVCGSFYLARDVRNLILSL